GNRKDEAGKSEIRKQLGVLDDRVRSPCHGLRGEVKWKHSRKQVYEKVRWSLALEEETEDQEVDGAQQQRVEDPPDQPERRGCVARLQVAQTQRHREFPPTP